MSIRFRLGLFLKFFISISILIVITTAVLSYFLINYQVGFLNLQLKDRGISIASALAYESEQGILLRNRASLSQALKRAVRDKDVAYAIVHDRSGAVLAISQEKMGIPIPSSIRRTFEAAATSAKEPFVQLYSTEILLEPIYDIALPVSTTGDEILESTLEVSSSRSRIPTKIGTVRVGVSLDATNKAVAELVDLSHRVTAVVIVIGIIFAALLVGIITTPLRELLSGMLKVAEGELVPVNVKSGDEIGALASAFNQMVMELLKYRRHSEGSRKNLEAKVSERTKEAEELRSYSENVIATMAEGLVTIDFEGNITLVNGALEDLSGHLRSELVGSRMVSMLFPGKDREKAIEAVEKTREAGVVRDIDLTLNRSDGRAVPVSFSAALLKDPLSKFQGMVIILHDMSKEREAERLKSEFISTISHELRTPLTSIEGFVSIILGGKTGEVPKQQAEFLKIVWSQAKHLERLIKNLLDFSRFTAGKIDIDRTSISLNQVIDEVISAMSIQIQDKKFTLETHIEEDLPKVNGDPEKLVMVISNLIGNALKFNEGAGKIKLEAKKTDGQITVSISDNGMGIAKENLDKIFTRFYQVDSTLTRKIGGAGIGLAVAKEIVSAHGGNIRAESPGLNKGSTFIFTLPAG